MTHVLVPVAILEGGTVSSGLVNLLSTMDVTVLGYHVLPEQTPPDQARAQFEDRANEALDDLTEEFRSAGGEAYHRLVFTQNRQQTIDRIADETSARAYAITGTTGPVDNVLVSLAGDTDATQIVEFVVELIGDRPIEVTLFIADGDVASDDSLATATEQLSAAGIETTTRVAEGNTFDALIDAVAGHDAVVMGERAPSLSSLLFGEEADRVAAASVGPVLVVRSSAAAADADDSDDNDT
ncbi:universal stress protein [Halobacteriaceae archaeon SHR40]|uniref:universal stress protein n=1 Tax=Halovenus amylolytica TaxID=2500550 RepID=UPI000FE30AF3